MDFITLISIRRRGHTIESAETLRLMMIIE